MQWACPVCPKIMKRPVEIRRHILVHTGEKPFKCDLCPYSYKRKAVLQKHIETYH